MAMEAMSELGFRPTERLADSLAEPWRLNLSVDEPGAPSASEALSGDFATAVRGLLNNVETSQSEAAQKTRDLLVGEPVELHEVLLAVEKAQLSFHTLMAVRTKVLEAYQELSRMPV